MNKLHVLENMGFKISWKLLYIGLYGEDEIPVSLTCDEVCDYLDSLLKVIYGQTDNIITLIGEKEDSEKFEKLLKKLADEDDFNIGIQKRKWRAYLLQNVIENIHEDWFEGLLELTEFWITMGMPADCPLTLPRSGKKKAVQEYYSQPSYECNLNKNREWLKEEIRSMMQWEASKVSALNEIKSL